MYRWVVAATLVALSGCAAPQGARLADTGPATVLRGAAEGSAPVAGGGAIEGAVPVVDIASTTRYGRGPFCDDRPPPGSRIRNLRCYERKPDMSFDEYMSLPDGLKPAGAMLPPR